MKYGQTFGLYRDDGLGVIKATLRKVESMKKDLCTIFNNYGLKITIEANQKIVNFLDVTLNLSTGKYQPYSKPNTSHSMSIVSPTTHLTFFAISLIAKVTQKMRGKQLMESQEGVRNKILSMKLSYQRK